MISINNLGKTFPDKKLFQKVNLKFIKGNTYGVIGANGAGKTTFLKMLSGEVEQSEGEIIIESGKRLSVLAQDRSKHLEDEVTKVVIMGNKDLHAVEVEKNNIYSNPDATDADYVKAGELEEKFGMMGGYTAESDAQILLNGLGIPKDKYNLKMKDLKAGEIVKVLLAQALFGNPDILILDEPTNHLDLKAIKWLENFLAEYENLVILVSHDSDFLDQVCTNIVDIDFGGAKMFTGNYSFWKQSSELAKELIQKQNAKAEDRKKQLEAFVAKFSANASKSSQATSRKKMLEKINIEEIQPSNRKYPFIRWELNREPGKDILKVEDLSYVSENGEQLFANLNFSIHKGEKVAILGQDDIAKTKFFEILMGITKPTTGSVKWGVTVKPDYYPKNNDKYFEKGEKLMEWISQWPLDNDEELNKDNSDSRMRSFLGRMLFSGDSALKSTKGLSGGEKARLMFSRMMLRESNFLVLDQPLDHLDTESIDSVVDGVRNYKSGVVFSTYNRAFIKECANVLIEIKSDSSFMFRGNLDEYERKMGY